MPRVALPIVTAVAMFPPPLAVTVVRIAPLTESSVTRTLSPDRNPPARTVTLVVAVPLTGETVNPVTGFDGADEADGTAVGTPLVLMKSNHLTERELWPASFRDRICQTCCPVLSTGVVQVVPVSHGLVVRPSSSTTW